MNFTFVTLKYNQTAAARRGGASHAPKIVIDSKNVISPRLRGRAARAPMRRDNNFLLA